MKHCFTLSVLAIAMVSTSLNLNAEETNRDDEGHIKRGAYSVERKGGFFDNMFFEAQAGAICIFADKMGQGIASDWACLKPQENFGFNLGKWFTPSIGARIGFQGFKTCWKEPRFWNTQHQSLAYVHADFMWNVVNTFFGYRTKRVYSLIPYIQAGMIWQNSDHSGHNNHLGLGVGLDNEFRICRWLAITADFRYTGAESSVLGKTYTSYTDKAKIGGYFSAQAGLKFTIREGFERTATTVKVATSNYRSEIDDLKKALENANSQIDSLRNRKPGTRVDTVYINQVAVDKVNAVLNAPTMFEQGKDIVRPEAKALLIQVASYLDKEKTYMITGYTSPEGSRSLNAKLRILRPEAVKRVLVDELGFKDDKIFVRAASETENEYSAIRAAIIREVK